MGGKFRDQFNFRDAILDLHNTAGSGIKSRITFLSRGQYHAVSPVGRMMASSLP